LETHAQIETETLDRYVSRLEALNDERGEVNASIKAVYEEAKNAGFVTAIIRQIVKERRMEETERHDHYALLDAYRSALGMLADLPLGQAAMASAEDDFAARRAENIAATEASRDDRNGQTADRPKPFAAQPVHAPERKRGRRNVLFDQEHPQGTA
jgi:uncharacterized protein (UPF0335 family)